MQAQRRNVAYRQYNCMCLKFASLKLSLGSLGCGARAAFCSQSLGFQSLLAASLGESTSGV